MYEYGHKECFIRRFLFDLKLIIPCAYVCMHYHKYFLRVILIVDFYIKIILNITLWQLLSNKKVLLISTTYAYAWGSL
jgi:hypothetical protein